MKVTVTGASGFLGTHFIHSIKKKNNISVDIIRHGVAADKLKLKGATCLVHLAGVNRGTENELKLGNVDYTKKVISWVKRYAPKVTIIYASSPQVYLKNSYYGKMKLRAEKCLRAYALKNHVRCIVLRFSNIYGPFCRPYYNSALATFIYQIMHNRKLIISGDGNQKRDFIYVKDAVNAINKAMFYNSKKEFQIYDICSGLHTSINELIEELKKCSPKQVHYTYESETTRPMDWPLRFPKKAKLDLLWRPVVSIRQGLKNIFREEYEN